MHAGQTFVDGLGDGLLRGFQTTQLVLQSLEAGRGELFQQSQSHAQFSGSGLLGRPGLGQLLLQDFEPGPYGFLRLARTLVQYNKILLEIFHRARGFVE